MRFVKFVSVFIAIFTVSAVLLVSCVLFLIPKLQQDTAILVLGKGGEGHTAPNLTDTIIVAYLNSNSKSAKFLSLPRDIWIPEIRAKLNSAYYYGGFNMAKESTQNVTGQAVQHVVVVDFSLFKDLIDGLGGITVDVSRSFTDKLYPIAGLENDLCNGDKLYKCRYESISFEQGGQNMNGELALKFVRSRNAEGDEGTDIAREMRQQKVITAIKQKVASKEVILNPKLLKNLYTILIAHLETDIDKNTALALVRFMIESRNNISFLNPPEDMLQVFENNRKYDYQYVFLPKSGSWKELQEWIQKEI